MDGRCARREKGISYAPELSNMDEARILAFPRRIMKILVILNPGAGKGSSPDAENKTEEIAKAFQAVNVDAQIVCPGVSDLTAFTKQAVISHFDAVVAAGGDGTISAVAAALVGTSTPLGILPLGTLNHLAKDLKIPFDLQEAARAIAEGKIHEIDVGEVNGRIFVNNSSIGLYPKAVRKRDQEIIRLGRGKWPAMLDASLRVFLRFPLITIRLETSEGSLTSTTPFLFVGNNKYGMKFLRIGDRTSLERGELCAYLLKHTGRLAFLRILLMAILGLRQDRDFTFILSREVQVQTRRRQITVSADGQLMALDTPLHYRIRPKALRVFAPEIAIP
jgi:diacylglycerol kinase family enzyme